MCKKGSIGYPFFWEKGEHIQLLYGNPSFVPGTAHLKKKFSNFFLNRGTFNVHVNSSLNKVNSSSNKVNSSLNKVREPRIQSAHIPGR